MAKDYENLFILKPDLTEEQVDEQVRPVRDLIESEGGSIITEDRWGKRRLAYLIKKNRYGYYILMRFSANPETVAKVTRNFRLNENVLKSMVVHFNAAAGRLEENQAGAAAGKTAGAAGDDDDTENDG